MRVRIVRFRECHCEAIIRCGGPDWMKGPERCRQQGFEITYNVVLCCCCGWERVVERCNFPHKVRPSGVVWSCLQRTKPPPNPNHLADNTRAGEHFLLWISAFGHSFDPSIFLVYYSVI